MLYHAGDFVQRQDRFASGWERLETRLGVPYTGRSVRGADLCVVDLGIQVPFPPGSIAAILGREFEHLTSAWTGERTCVVHTNHQSVREEAEERMAEPEGQRGLAKRLRVEAAKQPADAGKDDKRQPRPEGGSGHGEGMGDRQAPGLGRGGKRKRSE